MSNDKDTFTVDEVRSLVFYAQAIVFDAVQANLKSRSEEDFEVISVRLSRRWCRLLVHPELILEENPGGKPSVRDIPLSKQEWELFLGSPGINAKNSKNLSDEALIRLFFKQVTNSR